MLTFPPPEGVAQVPSPRQNVLDDAPEPPFRFPTGRFPVTPVLSGRPVALVRIAAEGVPRFGVVMTQEVVRHNEVPLPLVPYEVPHEDVPE